MNKLPGLLLLLALLCTIIGCSKNADNKPSNTNSSSASLVNKWQLSVDSMVVYDNGTEVQRSESEYTIGAYDFYYIQFNTDGTGMQTTFNGTMTDTPLDYTLSNNAITINFHESDLDDPPYALMGTVQTLTSGKLVLDLQQTVVKGSVTEKTTHHMNFIKPQ
jgi:hypothetical protein